MAISRHYSRRKLERTLSNRLCRPASQSKRKKSCRRKERWSALRAQSKLCERTVPLQRKAHGQESAVRDCQLVTLRLYLGHFCGTHTPGPVCTSFRLLQQLVVFEFKPFGLNSGWCNTQIWSARLTGTPLSNSHEWPPASNEMRPCTTRASTDPFIGSIESRNRPCPGM